MLLALGRKSGYPVFKVLEVKHHQVAIEELKKLLGLLLICLKQYLALGIKSANGSVHAFAQKLE